MGVLRGLLLHLLLGLSESEVRAVADAWPLLRQAAIGDAGRRAGRRRIEAAYAEARRIVTGGDYNPYAPAADDALAMLLASTASRRLGDGSIVLDARQDVAESRLQTQYNLEITKNLLGIPPTQKKNSPEVAARNSGVHSGGGDLLERTEMEAA